jgi:hypothetical protein
MRNNEKKNRKHASSVFKVQNQISVVDIFCFKKPEIGFFEFAIKEKKSIWPSFSNTCKK